jgi:diketogulonate reductase-like aldo/keto reductase
VRDRLVAIAAELGLTLAQLVPAWLLAKGDDVVPVVGMTRTGRVDENVIAPTVTLDPTDLVRIEAAAPPQAWSGTSSSFRRAPTGPARAATRPPEEDCDGVVQLGGRRDRCCDTLAP